MMVDDEDIGAGAFISHWVRIKGPDETNPVLGAAVTRPTFYFYDLEDQTDNQKFGKAGKESGLPFRKIKSADWVGTGTERPGRIVEQEQVGYSWTETVKPYPDPGRPIGFNLKIYHKGSTSKVECVLRLNGLNSPTNGQAGTGSVFHRWYGITTFRGLSMDTDTTCKAMWIPAPD